MRRARGEYAEAGVSYQQAVEMSKGILGDAHCTTAAALHCQAMLAVDNCQYATALSQLEQAHLIRGSALGDDHPDTLLSAVGLGRVHCLQGRFVDAKKAKHLCSRTTH